MSCAFETPYLEVEGTAKVSVTSIIDTAVWRDTRMEATTDNGRPETTDR